MDVKLLDSRIVGALFDFMAWLTTRDSVLCLGSHESCGPAVDVLKDFCKMRNINIDNTDVQRDWKKWINKI